MKKLLSILASISIAASSSAGVVACGTETPKTQNANAYVNNDLDAILSSSFEKAKTVIFDNEFGVSQNTSAKVMDDRTLSQDGINLSKNDGFDGNSKVSSLINRYFGKADASSHGHETNVNLGGVNGNTSGLSYLISTALDATIKSPLVKNFVLRNLDNAISWLSTTTSLVNTPTIESVNQSAFNLGIGDKWLPNVVLSTITDNVNKIKDTSYGKIIVKIIDGILSGKEKFSGFLDTIFDNKYVDIARQVMKAAFEDNALNKAVYGETGFTLPNLDGETQGPDDSIKVSGASKAEIKLDDSGSKADDSASTITYTSTNTKIPDVTIAGIKDELANTIDTILRTIVVFPTTKDAGKDAKNTLTSDLVTLITMLIGKQKVETVKFNQGIIMKIIVEGIRALTIINAWLSMYEDSHIENITSSSNLFSSTISNYEYLNGKNKQLGDKNAYDKTLKLSDTPYLQKVDGDTTTDPLNINYLISNLNYYFGSLDDQSGQGAYRVQQLLFLLMNDPSSETDPTTGDPIPSTGKSWTYKNSEILDLIMNVGLNVAYNILSVKTDDTSVAAAKAIKSIQSDPANIETIEDLLLKPVLLGLINGDSFKNLYDALVAGVQAALNSIPALQQLVAPFQDKIDEIMNSIKRLVSNPEFANDTLHSLFIVDFRPVINGLSIIPQDFLDKFFGINAPINLTTLLSMPLNKVLTLAKVPGFEGGKISPIGDYYTTQSIPKLLNILDNMFNFINGQGNKTASKYIVPVLDKDGNIVKDKDGNEEIDWAHSLKARDLDLSAIYGLFISIVGTNDGSKTSDPAANVSENIFSRLLNVIVTGGKDDDPSQALKDAIAKGEVPTIRVVPSELLAVIGAKAPGGGAPGNKTSFASADEKDSGGDSPSPVVPITYTKNGFTWSLYKMVLPLIDHTAPHEAEDFKMDPKYLAIDLLNDSYTKLITVLNNLNTAPFANYSVMLNQILNYNESFTFSYDKKNIGYFADHHELVRSLKFKVIFKNPISGQTNTYTFSISRNSNITGFVINTITSDKDD